MIPHSIEVAVIGAGPAGAAMASLLIDNGIHPLVLEKQAFPRFMIGESLLPEAINCLEQSGLLDVVKSGGYQYKDGARFLTNEEERDIHFADKIPDGAGYAYEVQRKDFDQQLIDECIRKGTEVLFETEVLDITKIEGGFELLISSQGEEHMIKTRFLVDASGFGRVLAKQFELESPSNFPPKQALFTHLPDHIPTQEFDRNKIIIAQETKSDPVWYWAIPFSNSTCSVGVVMDINQSDFNSNVSLQEAYFQQLSKSHQLSSWFSESEPIRPVGLISGYSASIKRLYGDNYVVLGNAGEFIDPIFSSGVTIALKSAVMAAPLVVDSIKGQPVNWEDDFQLPLLEGVNTFKMYVEAWYTGVLQKLIYSSDQNEAMYRMICSVLAGYVWDRSNPFSKLSYERLLNISNIVTEEIQ